MMKVTKFKVLLYLKKGSTDKRGKAPIMGRITLNNSMAQFSCKLSCTTNLWNPRSGRLDGKSREAVEVNAKIDKMLLNINSAYDNLLKRNVDFTAQSIKELMQGSVECQVTLMDMMDKLYADMEKRVGLDRVEGSLVHYKQARTTLGKFVEAKFKTKDVAFGQLTNQFISDYYEYLITDCGFMSNSTRKHLAILKKSCRLAYKEGYANRLFFEKYKDESRAALMPYQKYKTLWYNLRKICKMAGTTQMVSPHMGRHYYASIVTLAENVPIDVISKMLGHTNITQTQVYARVTQKKLFEEAVKFAEATKDLVLVL